MQKIFIDEKQFNKKIILNNDQAKHYLKVLRMQCSQQVVIICNQQKYLYEVCNLKPFTLSYIKELKETSQNQFELNVFFAAIKSKNLEIAVQKAAELNVNNFYIFYFNYSQHNEKYNINRLQQIILNACQQANRNSLMQIKVIKNNNDLLNLLNDNDVNYIAHLTDTKKYISKNINSKYKKIGVLIGPEGGLSDNDLSLINIKNSCIISLTNTILRSETALIYVVSVVSEMMLRGK